MKIVAMLPVYNEADVVGQVINWLVKQGMSLVVIDNGSSDDSFDICSNYLGRGVLHIEQVPTQSFKFQWLLERLYTTALRYAPDWAIICAADEFPESPYRGMSLKKAVEQEAQRGYNIIQFNRFEFWPTEKDHLNEEDVRSRVRYYTWDRAYQFRCWRVVPGITVREAAGHYPIFPSNIPYILSPTKFVLRHYGIRSYEQGIKKIFRDRLPRYDAQERRRGWHIHYDFIARVPHRLVADSSELTEYHQGTPWNLQQTFDSTQGVSGNLGYFFANLVKPNASLRDFLAVAIDLSRRRYIAKWGNQQSKLSHLVRKIIFSSWIRLLMFDWRD